MTPPLLVAHPWHGVDPGPDDQGRVRVYVEIVPTDTVKYELDKSSGLLCIDRPQRFSSSCPSLYGFVPRTWCGPRVGDRCAERAGRPPGSIRGDGDPIDACVLTEKPIPTGGFLAYAFPIGGLRYLDADEADDKIVAVLAGDLVYGGLRELAECPHDVLERLRHYLLSYKQLPTDPHRRGVIVETYGRDEAMDTIRLSALDYREKFGAAEQVVAPRG